MEKKVIYDEVLQQLIEYVEKENYKGYDPYDTLNSKWNFKRLGKWGPVLAIQFQKRNPVNIRKILGIRKERNPKAIGLFLHSYSLLFSKTNNKEYKQKADELFDWLMNCPTNGFEGLCWGYNFDWASPVKYLDAFSPTIVVSGFISKGIFEYYLATGNERAKEALFEIEKFVDKYLEVTEDSSGICYSYSTIVKDCCYNASLLAGELYARLYYLSKEDLYKEKAIQIANFVLKRQHPDGHWNYSVEIETGKEREQIDFHQGYVLDSLCFIKEYCKVEDPAYDESINKGLEYYSKIQFNENGSAIWRVPKKWPVDIHNQAQGIITFSRFGNKEQKNQAKTIADFTIKKMRNNRKGYFYYKKYPLYKIRTPFMRWSQAWMMLALTELIINMEN